MSEWNHYGKEPPCEHLLTLHAFLESTNIGIWSEHDEQPAGWVNVQCFHCHRTYEVTLRPPWEIE